MPAAINTEHFEKSLKTLEVAFKGLLASSAETDTYEVYRYATIKGFELCLELSGKLLRKKLKAYEGDPRQVDTLTYKDIFRHALKHNLLETQAVERWFTYRDNRNNTAHDYGLAFVEQTITLLPNFINDAKQLAHLVSQP